MFLNLRFQFVVEHRVAAVLYDDDFADPLFKIRHRLYEHVRPVRIVERTVAIFAALPFICRIVRSISRHNFLS